MGAGLLLALVTPAASLRAAAPAGRVVRLSYTRASGAEQCPDQDEIERQVRARLGHEPFTSDAPSALSAVIGPSRRGLQARIELRGPGGKVEGVRELDSPGGDCTELAASVAFALSMAIDPLAAVRAPPPASSASPRPPAASALPPASGPATASAPPSSRPPVAPPSSSPAPRPSPPASARASAAPGDAAPPAAPGTPGQRPAVLVSAGLMLVLGQSPELAPALVLGLGARWPWWSINLEGRYVYAKVEVAGDRGVLYSLVSGAVAPCVHGTWLFGCAVAMVGLADGKDFGFESIHSDRSLFASAGGRAGLRYPVNEVMWMGVSGELLANLTPINQRLNQQPFWTSPLLAGGITATYGLSF